MNMLRKLFVGLLIATPALAPRLAMAAVNARTVQKIVKEGLTTTNISTSLVSTDTNTFSNDGRTFLHFAKTGAGAATITVIAQATVQGMAVANLTVSVPATTGDVFLGPFPPSIFNDASSNVSFTISDTVGLSFALLRL